MYIIFIVPPIAYLVVPDASVMEPLSSAANPASPEIWFDHVPKNPDGTQATGLLSQCFS